MTINAPLLQTIGLLTAIFYFVQTLKIWLSHSFSYPKFSSTLYFSQCRYVCFQAASMFKTHNFHIFFNGIVKAVFFRI